MNSTMKTAVFVAVAAVLAFVASRSTPDISEPEMFNDEGELFFADFSEPTDAAALEVLQYSPETSELLPFRIQVKDGRWSIPSHHDYPADAKDQMAEAAGMLVGLKKAAVRSDRPEDHTLLGVNDPTDEATDSEGRGTLVSFEDDAGNSLATLIIGNGVEGQGAEGYRYVRVPGQKRTYTAKLPTIPSTQFEEWIEKDLLDVTASQINELTFDNYSIDEASLSRVPGEIIVAKKVEDDWSVEGLDPEREEVNEEAFSDITDTLADLEIVGVRQKPSGLTENLIQSGGITLTPENVFSLQGHGFFVGPDGHLFANEGDLLVNDDRGIVYKLSFGEVLFGSGDSVTAGGPEENVGEGLLANRYLMILTGFDAQHLGAPPEGALSSEEMKLRATARGTIQWLASGLEAWQKENEGVPESLAVLLESENAAIKELPKDPWGNEYVLEVIPGEEMVLIVRSLGADGAAGGEGVAHDISSDDFAHEDALDQLAYALSEFEGKVSAGQETAGNLARRFAPWYYVIDEGSFLALHRGRNQLVSEKLEDETVGEEEN